MIHLFGRAWSGIRLREDSMPMSLQHGHPPLPQHPRMNDPWGIAMWASRVRSTLKWMNTVCLAPRLFRARGCPHHTRGGPRGGGGPLRSFGRPTWMTMSRRMWILYTHRHCRSRSLPHWRNLCTSLIRHMSRNPNPYRRTRMCKFRPYHSHNS